MTTKDREIQNALDALAVNPNTYRLTAIDRTQRDPMLIVRDIREVWLEVVEIFVGLEELPGNRGFWHDRFAASLHVAKGLPYCQGFIEFTVQFASGIVGIPDWLKSDTAASQKLWDYAVAGGFTRKHPERGFVSVWRNGKTPYGHVGAVRLFDEKGFDSTEANTSSPVDKWREGRWIMHKSHTLSRVGEALKHGRWLRGFVDTDALILRALLEAK